jgi:protein TonB
MQKENILTASLLDLVFEGRNKAYGAYELRNHYAQRLAKAVGLVMAMSAAIVVGSLFAQKPAQTAGTLVVVDSVVLQSLDNPPPQPVEPPPAPEPAAPEAMAAITPPMIMPDDEVPPEETMPDLDRIDTSRVGLQNVDGAASDNTVAAAPLQRGTGIVEDPAPVTAEDPNAILEKVEIAASFPGGIEAWRRYLQHHMNYPETAQENGTQGPVKVQFVVDKEGNISDVEALNDPGDGIAAEAVRIIRQGPKWKPAQQNGRFVNYRHVQSIVFQLE